jgi:hypothetical protein
MNASLRHRLSIHQACTSEEVLDAVNAYFSGLTGAQRDSLPAALRDTAPWGPARISAALPGSALHSRDHGAEASLLREVRALLTLASLRLEIIAMEAGRRTG